MTDDPWRRQDALARTTVVWAAASIAAGVVALRRNDRWARAFGGQHLGWGVIDLGIVAVVTVLQRRRMVRAGDPYAPAARERERRQLHRVLAINTAADVGYVVVGAVLATRKDPRAAGAGAAIVIQGAFLAAHDGWHAVRSRS